MTDPALVALRVAAVEHFRCPMCKSQPGEFCRTTQQRWAQARAHYENYNYVHVARIARLRQWKPEMVPACV